MQLLRKNGYGHVLVLSSAEAGDTKLDTRPATTPWCLKCISKSIYFCIYIGDSLAESKHAPLSQNMPLNQNMPGDPGGTTVSQNMPGDPGGNTVKYKSRKTRRCGGNSKCRRGFLRPKVGLLFAAWI